MKIVAVDLQAMAPLSGVVQIQGDITKVFCININNHMYIKHKYANSRPKCLWLSYGSSLIGIYFNIVYACTYCIYMVFRCRRIFKSGAITQFEVAFTHSN